VVRNNCISMSYAGPLEDGRYEAGGNVALDDGPLSIDNR
jgi:hypothetical protein